MIESGEGVWLIDTDGRRYIDGVSSLWCNVHGHRHPRIDAAVREQLDRVAHADDARPLAPGARRAGQRLVELAPGARARASSTRTAARPRSRSRSRWPSSTGSRRGPSRWRTKFVCLETPTTATRSARCPSAGSTCSTRCTARCCSTRTACPPGDPAHRGRLLDAHGGRGRRRRGGAARAGRRRDARAAEGYLRAVRELCDRHGRPADLRRGGDRLRSHRDDVRLRAGGRGARLPVPREGLTGGYLPLAATLATERVYEGFLGEFEEFRTFFHGHTYTGNPLACAAALATLDVFEEERTLERLAPKIALLGSCWTTSSRRSRWREVRRCGFMCGIELAPASQVGARMGHRVTLAARARGAIVRPLGDVVVLMPPLSIGRTSCEELVEITADSIAEAATGRTRWPPRPWLLLVGDEVLLARAADRAEPVVGDLLERGAGRDAAVGIALGRVVDEAARLADPASGLSRPRPARGVVCPSTQPRCCRPTHGRPPHRGAQSRRADRGSAGGGVILLRRGGKHSSAGLEVLLGRRTTQRALHGGRVGLPGGAMDGATSGGPPTAGTALRELEEEASVAVTFSGPRPRPVLALDHARGGEGPLRHVVLRRARRRPAAGAVRRRQVSGRPRVATPPDALDAGRARGAEARVPTIKHLEQLAGLDSVADTLAAADVQSRSSPRS